MSNKPESFVEWVEEGIRLGMFISTPERPLYDWQVKNFLTQFGDWHHKVLVSAEIRPSDERTERGVMVVKNGKGWGKAESDGYSTYEGWMDLACAEIHDPAFCKKPTDVTYENSHFIEELKDAQLIHVVRRTRVTLNSL